MVNPNRGGAWRGGHVNGRGGAGAGPRSVVAHNPTTHADNGVSPGVSVPPHSNNFNRGGMFSRGGGRGFRGRGFGGPGGDDRGRGVPRGGFRGRGRGSFAAPQVVS
jgi:hypothetical protein